MATEQELIALENSLRPLVEDAVRNGEDLSTHADLTRFIERVLSQNGYVLRGDTYVRSRN